MNAPDPKRLEEELALARRKLKGIEEISHALATERNPDRALDTVMEITTDLMGAERSTLFLVEEGTSRLTSRITQGDDVDVIDIAVGQGLAGWVAEHGRTVNVKDAYKDHRFDRSTDQLTGYRTRSVLCAPLRDPAGQVIGVIEVLNKIDGYFTPADEELCLAIAAQAAIGILNSKLYVDIVGKNIDLMQTTDRLADRTRELEQLFRIERAAATATRLDEALDAVLRETLDLFPSEIGAVVLVDEGRDALHVASWRTARPREAAPGGGEAEASPAPELQEERRRVLETLAARVVASGEPFRHPNGDDEVLAGSSVRSAVAHPIVHQTKRLGALVLVNRIERPRGFEPEAGEPRLVGLIAARLGLSVVLGLAVEEEQKAERLATIGQMLSGVLHDLKTPLTIIGGYARLMAGEEAADARRQHREQIRRQIDTLKDMTRELLAFARGESEVLLRRVFVREFLKAMAEELQEEFKGSGVELRIDDDYGGTVRMDENKMRRVAFNLARNAREAMGEGGVFRIAVAGDGSDVVFRFEDTGPGIPEAMRGRLFDPFATYGKANGTGLGLAIVKKIVDEHHGRIEVESEPGRGTTFVLRVPVEERSREGTLA